MIQGIERMASRVPYSLKRRGIDMERLKLLKGITFGERVAEDETSRAHLRVVQMKRGSKYIENGRSL